MKKSTKILLGISLVSMLVGGVGVAVNVGKLFSNRLDVQTYLEKDTHKLTIALPEKSDINLTIIQNDSDSLAFNETFGLNTTKYELNEGEEKVTLSLDNYTKAEENNKIGITVNHFKQVTVSVPPQITELTLISDSQNYVHSNLSDLTLEKLEVTTKNSSTNIHSISVKELNATSIRGDFSLSDTTVSDNFKLNSDSGDVFVTSTKFAKESHLNSLSGNLTVKNNLATNLTLSSEQGSLLLDDASGLVSGTTKTGDIYVVNRRKTTEGTLATTSGNIFSVTSEPLKDKMFFDISNIKEVLNNQLEKNATTENTQHALKLTTESGQLNLLKLIPATEDENFDDFDDTDEQYYKIQKPEISIESEAPFLKFDSYTPLSDSLF